LDKFHLPEIIQVMPPKITALIIDDETLAREIIKKYLSQINEIEIIGESGNGFDAVKKINMLNPQLIFLDIQMPKITGFEMLELLDNPPVIIFTTAYDHYAIKAFEVNAADYLLKPFSEERFKEAVSKAVEKINKNESKLPVVDNLIKHKESSLEIIERVVVKTGSKITVIPVDEIKYIEAKDDYVMIHSAGGNFLKQKTMKYFEEHLPPSGFVRIHRSYIASIKEIKNIELLEKESYIATLSNMDKLPVSKNGYDKLKEFFK
jgi:two-component system, LytTR family, response regulator